MNRPNPAMDLIGYLNWLGDVAEALIAKEEERRVSASEAARELGYHKGYFHGRPWRIPDFGFHGYMHSLRDWRNWNARPEAERRAEWDRLPVKERSKARGAA